MQLLGIRNSTVICGRRRRRLSVQPRCSPLTPHQGRGLVGSIVGAVTSGAPAGSGRWAYVTAYPERFRLQPHTNLPRHTISPGGCTMRTAGRTPCQTLPSMLTFGLCWLAACDRNSQGFGGRPWQCRHGACVKTSGEMAFLRVVGGGVMVYGLD